MASRGQFIVLEGLEGSGKTTNLLWIKERLAAAGLEVITTREPGGTGVAEQIRALLLADHEEPIWPLTELWLMFAARMQHVQQVIKPALAAGKWVLCDRFLEASYAYQGGGRGIPDSQIDFLAEQIQREATPDCVLYLDVSLETSMARIATRGVLDRFEQEGEAFFSRIHQSYRQRARTLATHKWIDAECALPRVRQQIENVLLALYPQQLGLRACP